ncbi:MAG TPA: hypothetical protein VNP04_28955 [Alphaproteobacteria bacterium]|nr:hypothetical protein [Alphaproteobacteria bacterium]
MLLERGEPGDAAQAFEAALRRHPHRLNALYGAALASELNDDLTKAYVFYIRLADAAAQAGDRFKLTQAQAFLANGHREP